MNRSLAALLACAALWAAAPARAQSTYPTPQPNINVPGMVEMCPTLVGNYVPCGSAGAQPRSVTVTGGPVPVAPSAYPPGAIPITGNATGTTGAVVGTLAAKTGATTYLCWLDVSALGGTATVGPITVAGVVGSSIVYQFSSTAAGATLSRTFTPCIPASAVNTAITITTTADGTATNVDVNSGGYQQ